MKYRVKFGGDLLDAPNGNFKDSLVANQTVTGIGKKSGDFIEVKTSADTGWAHKDDLVALEREILALEAFVRETIIAERTFNDLEQTGFWFVLADFIIARALIETRPEISNVGNKFEGSDAVGPLQVSSAEWNRFLGGDFPIKQGYEPDDFDNYLMQVWGAAYTMHADAKAISKVKQEAGLGSDEDPPLPSYLEIYLAYLTGSPKAAVVLVAGTATAEDMGQKDAASSPQPPGPDRAVKLNELLKTKGGMSSDGIATLFKRRATWTGSNDANAKTAGEFVTAVSDELNKALREAFELIQKHAPETIVPPGEGPAPWFTVARTEEAKLKDLDESAPVADARIKAYFQSIGMAAGGSTPWCAAFVSFCVKNSGNDTVAATVPKRGPALAASWQFWGEPLPVNAKTLPPGAVVVLIPTEKSDSSGHVGFYARGDDKTVTLLGGNQSNRLKESTYSRSRVVAVRWLNASEASLTPVQATNIKLNAFNAQQQEMAKLIIQKFADAGFNRLHQIAAVANAWRESSLIPTKQTTTAKEDSVGLFQLNMKGGLGEGHDPDELKKPEKNISLIIDKCKRVGEFRRAATLEQAVAAFVRFVEIPGNMEAEIADRLAKANSLLA